MLGKKKIPVYLINGFLESGKTEFIRYTLAQPYFQIDERTLLILCEEGLREYDERILKKSFTTVEVIEDEEDFTIDSLRYLEKKVKPGRIVIEFNGMWNPKNIKLPDNWSLDQQITIINAETFPMYYTNMKSIVAEHVRRSELIIFNRCREIEPLSNYKRNIKAINAQAEIVFEDEEGEISVSLAEDLPYSLDDPVIVLDDNSYGIWYIDVMDNPERYEGLVVEFIGTVAKPPGLKGNEFVPGRLAMTCCADDMAFLGFICRWKGAKDLPEKEWVRVRGRVSLEPHPMYNGVGAILDLEEVSTCKTPKNEIIDFANM